MNTRALFCNLFRLACISRLSSLIAVTIVVFGSILNAANAHEVRPAIADVTVNSMSVSVEISLAVEALVAGLDLAELQDTNESPLAQAYDNLRGLNSAELESAFRAQWPEIATGINLLAGTIVLNPALKSIEIGPVGNVDIARESILRFDAPLPQDGSAVSLGWVAGYGPLVVRQVLAGGGGYAGYLIGREQSAPIPRSGSARQSGLTAFLDYVGIGFEHIVPKGLDHILFVLGLFFFSLKLRPLLVQITAFTVAHTVALALGILGYVQIPAAVVEPLIAASIVYVAVENITTTTYRRSRTAVVFGFGLLHGLGFAAVLGDIGLEPGRFITGLIGFNVGVELGQITVIAAAFLAVGIWFGQKEWYRRVIAIPASLGIAIVGAFWTVQRVFF